MAEAKVFPGVYRAAVTDTEDPQGRGRIQVELPSLARGERVWAPMLTQRRDSLLAAEVGDEVLVAFEAGDLASPFVLGMLWSSSACPPTATGS